MGFLVRWDIHREGWDIPCVDRIVWNVQGFRWGGGGCRVTGGGEEPPVYPLSDIYDVPVSAPLGRNACHLL